MENKMIDETIITSVNPATGEVIGQTKENSVEDLINAIKKARVAQKNWASKSFDERKKYLFKIRDYIVDNADRISEIISKDSGKTRFDALSTEVFPITMALSYYGKNAKRFLKRKKINSGNILLINKKTYIERVPYGIIGIISPWNYPFAIPFHEIAMALIAGNAVILKVATQTLEVGKIILECVNSANLPVELFSLINLNGKIAGDAFIENGIDKLFFTGSVDVGKKLMKKCSEKLLPFSLELGGNDAMIVCNDANIIRAVGGALWAGLSNSGQSCAGVERIFVEEKIYDEFVSLLKQKIKNLKQGADLDFNVDVGSMTTEKQLNIVKVHTQDAIEKGANVFSSFNLEKESVGFFHPIIVLENVNENMVTMNEETFGPVLAIKKVKDIDEAISLTNNSNLGLTASVWSKNRSKAKQIASMLEVGTVTINDHLMSHGLAETPWGGFKNSGLGRTHSYLGLEAMTQPRTVVDDSFSSLKRNMWWYPHNKKVYDGLKGGIDALYSKKILRKLKGLINLTKIFLRSFNDQ